MELHNTLVVSLEGDTNEDGTLSKKEKRKLKRKKRKEKRRSKRQLRNEKFEALIDAYENRAEIDYDKPWEAQFASLWPLLRSGAELIKALAVTGPNTDAVLEEVIAHGDAMAGGTGDGSQFIQSITPIWELIKFALEFAALFTSDHVDEIIETIIEIGDWVTQSENDLTIDIK